jgi:glutamine cyclotransferase
MDNTGRNRAMLLGMLVLFLALLFLGYQTMRPTGQSYYSIEVIATYPHDPDAFTQGLIYQDGLLYESTGLYGSSSVRISELSTGDIVDQVNLQNTFFGEGMTVLGDNIYQITWKENTGFVYSMSLDETSSFSYHGEGWGLTHDGENLILSNGTSTLAFMDPDTFEVIWTVDVTYDDAPVYRINELEYVDGVIYANIWQLDQIIIIDPTDGSTIGWIDLNGIKGHLDSTKGIDVLNGIAYNYDTGRLIVTGKLWPNVFEIELVPK